MLPKVRQRLIVSCVDYTGLSRTQAYRWLGDCCRVRLYGESGLFTGVGLCGPVFFPTGCTTGFWSGLERAAGLSDTGLAG